MAKWLSAKCSKCGPFWAQETTKKKIEKCSRCSSPLFDQPQNLIYSKEYLEEEDFCDEFTDFENYCRCQLTSSGEQKDGHYLPGEFRRPTQEEISDRGEYAVLEVKVYHENVKKIADYYHKQTKRENLDRHDIAWLNYWRQEHKKSLDRMNRMRHHWERIFMLLEESDHGDEFIRRSMNDLYTHEWFHNWELTEEGKLFLRHFPKKKSRSATVPSGELEDEIIEKDNFTNQYISSGPERSWSTEELAKNALFSLSFMKEDRDLLQKDVDHYRSEAPPPVNSETKFIWRKEKKLMHLTLVHPQKNGVEIIEIVGTDPNAISAARKRIEAARWLAQSEEDLHCQIEREQQLRANLNSIADILNELDYKDKFLNLSL